MLREMKIDFCPLRHIRITEGGLRAERLINNTETEGYSLNQLACADATDTTGSPQSLLWGLCLASWATDLDRLDSNLSSLPRLPLSAVRAGRIPRRALR